MDFIDKLNNTKQLILEKWFSITVESYPPDTSNFIKNQKDPFANPVGRTTLENLKKLLDGLVAGIDSKKLRTYVDPIIRIRAVQDFKPSEAVHFILDLKEITRQYFQINQSNNNYTELVAFDKRIDNLLSVAFDVFVSCREQIYDLKATETRNQIYKSLSKAGLIVET